MKLTHLFATCAAVVVMTACSRDSGTTATVSPDIVKALVGDYSIRSVTINSALYSENYLQNNPPITNAASIIQIEGNTILLSYALGMQIFTPQGVVPLYGSKTVKMYVQKVSDIEYVLKSADTNNFSGTFYNTVLAVGNGTDGITAALKK